MSHSCKLCESRFIDSMHFSRSNSGIDVSGVVSSFVLRHRSSSKHTHTHKLLVLIYPNLVPFKRINKSQIIETILKLISYIETNFESMTQLKSLIKN